MYVAISVDIFVQMIGISLRFVHKYNIHFILHVVL